LFICGTFRVSQNTGFLNLNGGTLRTTNLSNNGTATLTFNGGTLQAKAARTDFIATGVNTAQIQSGGAFIDSNNFAITIPKILTEDSTSTGGGLTKTGAGTLTLTAANSYTGPTNVQGGNLLINGDHTLATGVANADANAGLGGDGIIGTAIYDDGAKFPWTVTDWTAAPNLSAGAVTIDGALTVVVDDSLPTPVANFTDATTTFTILSASSLTVTNPAGLMVDATSFTAGTGTWAVQQDGNALKLVYTAASPSAFNTWATSTNGLTGADATATADPDNDGLDNAVEFVIGGQPNPANPNANSSALAPTISTDASNLIFTFRRTDLSLTQSGIVIAAEYGSDLVGWTTASDGVNGVVIAETNDIEVGVDQVQVSIPKTLATGAKMFARLNVVIP
jgi:autotransporter-associated beta strand protein